ncbi:FAD-binding and (Fe-S)-binding domain-containing protein [Microbacterium sp. MPKO10]|uniref:FAD-binding and (Fe-S)-binding domain-containing protein n=1 Tax=Microbacterium sp. MPKO10 TaxID=2989818 RepID=UPI0022358A14|nr:FAD-linked oxidase C-terminal domain-containing protein [Microbacterium sp. MPKO10]MCW4457461.1 FAD-binding protein [Microbacterium sp. MPKO10]
MRSRAIDRYAYAHDASHYLLVPETVLVPHDAADVARIFRAARTDGRALTFRSGGTSLSGQGVSGDVMVDVRRHFRGVEIDDDGRLARVQPGATVRNVNARLARYRTKLGPDPASEIACTIGGVVANNSSGMHCGTTQNTYRTIDSMLLVLPSGTVIDTADADADDQLRTREPEIHAGLLALRDRLRGDPASVATVNHQFSMKNTMGYGINALLDFDDPVDILQHLIVGSEGTLAFVAEARFATVPVYPNVATGLLVFDSLRDAMAALPGLVDHGFATVELMDAESLRVAQTLSDVPAVISGLDVAEHAALLVEVQASTGDALAELTASARRHIADLPLSSTPDLTTDATERASLWTVRKGLYTAIAGNRPSGTNALLEDIVVPVDNLLATCERLTELFAEHGYEASVIFGHAKDGNIHFMLNERFDDPASVARYERFTDDLVALVLDQRGSLKAEHGTGRIMAPFVRRQYGDELYGIMVELKNLIDPTGMLNPGVVLSDTSDSYMHHLKTAPTVESEVDRCVECGYCEPACPSRDITLTPRQRIVLRREIEQARERGDVALVAELSADYDYDGVQTCAVDGMCGIACPVDINTGDLVRRLREEQADAVAGAAWNVASKHWGTATQAGRAALNVAKVLPSPLVTGVTDAARAVLGADTVPRYTRDLPRGGSAPLNASHSTSSSAPSAAASSSSAASPPEAELRSTIGTARHKKEERSSETGAQTPPEAAGGPAAARRANTAAPHAADPDASIAEAPSAATGEGAAAAAAAAARPTAAAAAAAARPTAAEVVFFSSCVGTMFGPEPRAAVRSARSTSPRAHTVRNDGTSGGNSNGPRAQTGSERSAEGGAGVRGAMVRLLDHAGIGMIVPPDAGGLCCGTPWKSKGYASGYAAMATRVIDSLLVASRGGDVPIVCDGASCTEGLQVMVDHVRDARPEAGALRIEDATQFVAREIVPLLAAAPDQPADHAEPCSDAMRRDDARDETAGDAAHGERTAGGPLPDEGPSAGEDRPSGSSGSTQHPPARSRRSLDDETSAGESRSSVEASAVNGNSSMSRASGRKLRRVAVHPTCATEAIGATSALTDIAEAVADEAYVPVDWGCCGFAGDRGMLHPELTASATAPEAAEVQRCDSEVPFDGFVSANRPCEMAMTRATGKPYRHVLELLADQLGV